MTHKHWSVAVLALLLAGSVAACGEEDEDTAAKEMGDAIKKAGDQVEKVAKDIQEEMEE